MYCCYLTKRVLQHICTYDLALRCQEVQGISLRGFQPPNHQDI